MMGRQGAKCNMRRGSAAQVAYISSFTILLWTGWKTWWCEFCNVHHFIKRQHVLCCCLYYCLFKEILITTLDPINDCNTTSTYTWIHIGILHISFHFSLLLLIFTINSSLYFFYIEQIVSMKFNAQLIFLGLPSLNWTYTFHKIQTYESTTIVNETFFGGFVIRKSQFQTTKSISPP
jgi:hypothetical protein